METTDNQKTLKLKVQGMSCQNTCADGIDRKFNETNGIIKSTTSYDTSLSEITYDEFKISNKEIIEIVEKIGFEVRQV